jgi:capsid portal protein
MGEACLDGAVSAKNVRVSLRGAPLEAEVTIPDGRIVRVRVGLADDSYIPKRELDTVTVELYANGEHVAAITTVLDADQSDEARELLDEVVAGLESGDLPPTAGALEPLADRLR